MSVLQGEVDRGKRSPMSVLQGEVDRGKRSPISTCPTCRVIWTELHVHQCLSYRMNLTKIDVSVQRNELDIGRCSLMSVLQGELDGLCE